MSDVAGRPDVRTPKLLNSQTVFAMVDRLISAAQVFTQLLTAGHQKLPSTETPVRPLIGLPPEQVRLAWDKAVSNTDDKKSRATGQKGGRRVEELQALATDAPTPPKPRRARMAAHRRLIDDATGQLLLLVGQKANH